MMGKTHLTIGGAAWIGLALVPYMPYHSATAIAGGWFLAALGALGPDLDQRQSMGSRIFGPITQAISYVVRKVSGGHRKLTHSLLGMALLGAIAGVCIAMLHLIPWIAVAFVVGWLSHILADMITVQGCPLMYPFDDYKFGLHLMKTNHGGEHFVVFPLAILANIIFIGMVAAH